MSTPVRVYFSLNPPDITYSEFAGEGEDIWSEDSNLVLEGQLTRIQNLDSDEDGTDWSSVASTNHGLYVLNGFFVSPPMFAQTIPSNTYVQGQMQFRNLFLSSSVVDTTYCVVGIVGPGGIGDGFEVLAEEERQSSEGAFPVGLNPEMDGLAFRNHTLIEDYLNSGNDYEVEAGSRLIVLVWWKDTADIDPSLATAKYGTLAEAYEDLDLADETQEDIGRPFLEFGNTISFYELQTDFGTIEMAGSSTITGALRNLPAVHYRIYRSIEPTGPWELANDELVRDNQEGNSYTISDLTNGQVYYIMVVAGRVDDDGTFLPICGQPITETQDPGADVVNPNIVLARPRRVSNTTTASLALYVTLLETGTL